MPRLVRKTPGGVIYHVLNRGVEGGKLFPRKADYQVFESALLDTLAVQPIRLLGYVVLPNQWQLLLYPQKEGDVGKFMQRLTLTHVRRARVKRETVGDGQFYRDRYKSFPVQPNEYLLLLLRYMERSAVDARLVKRANDWRWSSLWARREGDKEHRDMLAALPVKLPSNWLALANRPLPEDDADLIETSIDRNRPLGDEAWVKRIAKRLNLEPSLRPRGRPRERGKN